MTIPYKWRCMLLYLIDYKSCWRISINMILYLLISFNFCQIIVNCWPLIKDPCVLHAIENLVFVGGPVFELGAVPQWRTRIFSDFNLGRWSILAASFSPRPGACCKASMSFGKCNHLQKFFQSRTKIFNHW